MDAFEAAGGSGVSESSAAALEAAVANINKNLPDGAQLSADDQKLTYQGQTVELTKNEYRILSCLMESAGKVVSREKLMQRLWETDSFVDENTLTVNVNRLRRKLAGVGLVEFIATRHIVFLFRINFKISRSFSSIEVEPSTI